MATRETALVTGASGGIGRALAECFARHGFDLVVVARRRERLEELAGLCRARHGVDVAVVPMDLLESDAVERLVARLESDGARVDVLVNDAGLLDMGRFAEIDVARHERVVQLNVGVLTSLTRRLLPGMIERGRGRILNVASTAAFQPVPSLALYAATKAFVLSLSESTSEELKGTGVTVTALCPGLTKTDMYESVAHGSAAARLVPEFLLSDAESVAKEGFEACLAGRAIVVPGLTNRMGANLAHLYPRWLVRKALGLIGRNV